MNKFWKIHSNHRPGAETRSQKDPNKIVLSNTPDTYLLAINDKPTFWHGPLFTAWCMVSCTRVHMVAHCAPGLTALLSADWSLLTVTSPDWAGRARTNTLTTGHTTPNINTSQSDKKNWRKNTSSFHPLGPSDPIITVKMRKLFHSYWQVLDM